MKLALSVVATTVLALALVVTPSSSYVAVAQTPTVTTTQSPSPSPSPSPSASASAADTGRSEELAYVLVAFGVVALGLVYWFLNRWRRDLGQVMGASLQRTNRLPDVVYSRQEGGGGGPRDVGALEQALEIGGPAMVTVGEEAAYEATGDGAQGATWTLTPADAGRLDPAQGARTTLVASKVGPLQIGVTVGAVTKTVAVAAMPPSESPGSIPIIGAGYGGVTIAIVAVTVAAALTAIGALPGAALATLLGTVVSYFFVRRETGGGGGS